MRAARPNCNIVIVSEMPASWSRSWPRRRPGRQPGRPGPGAVSDHLNRTRIANEARREVTADLVRADRAEIAALRARVEALRD